MRTTDKEGEAAYSHHPWSRNVLVSESYTQDLQHPSLYPQEADGFVLPRIWPGIPLYRGHRVEDDPPPPSKEWGKKEPQPAPSPAKPDHAPQPGSSRPKPGLPEPQPGAGSSVSISEEQMADSIKAMHQLLSLFEASGHDVTLTWKKNQVEAFLESITPDVLQCKFCDKKCSDATRLRDHVKGKHLNRKDYKCGKKDCGKTFSTKHAKDQHEAAHKVKKMKPKQVEALAKAAVKKGEKPKYFVCQVKVKKSSGEEPFDYKICNQVCTSLGHFKEHQETHKQDRNYKCTYAPCSKSFKQKKNLTSHKGICPHRPIARSESANPPNPSKQAKRFKCPYCPKGFTRSNDRKKHIIAKHPDRPLTP